MMKVLLRPKALNIREGKAVTDRLREKKDRIKLF